jgi:RNA polymerase sigma-70 factor (ECF subfamily)
MTPETSGSQPDEHEYTRVVARHRDELRAHSRRILRSGEDAEDAVQDALLKAWRSLPTFEGRGSLRSWLYRIVTNTSLDAARSRGVRVLPLEHEPAAAGGETDPEGRYVRRETLVRALLTADRILPERQREVLVLREALGFSAEETAERLGTSVPAVNSALQRARARIECEAGELVA